MDALIAVTIMSFALLSVSIVKPSAPSENTGFERMHYISEDAMQMFTMTTLSEINSTVSAEILGKTNLTPDYMNKSLIEAVGFLWADGHPEYVANISRDFFPGLIPREYNYSISVKGISGGKQMLYSSTGALPETGNVITLIKASRIVSGYQERTPTTGYTSRAWATKITKNSSRVYEFNPEGSSADSGDKMSVKKIFFINATEIYNATLFLSLHRGTSSLNSNSLYLDSSGDLIGSVNWLYTQEKTESGKTTNMDFGIIDLTTLLNQTPSGWHTIEIVLSSQGGFNTHIHPGTKLEVKYKTQEQRTFTGKYAERKYFDEINFDRGPASKDRGVWALMPIYVPKTANVKNVTLHLRALNVYDDPTKDDIQIYFNNNSILNATNPPATYDTYINLTGYVNSSRSMTNVVAVYIDNMDNTFWGKTKTELYSNPQADENSSSYVYVEYEWPREDKFRYGYIDVSTVKPFGGAMGNPKAYTETFGNNEITSTYLHVAQLDSENVTITVTPLGEPSSKAFESPRIRVLPSSIYIDPAYYNTSKPNNTINVSDVCTTLNCPVLPQSSLEYNIFVPSQVGYGSVFNTSVAAQNDALARLTAILSGYMTADAIEIDTPFTTGSVPWMYGPAIITFEVWK